ncbi:MAG: polyprenyl synthetase family protein [Anaerolineae bacterium]|nr:polyprenyl synthetase family protein [Anaerolineae bacterium]
MPLEDVVARVLALPEVSAWPEMAHLFEQSVAGLRIKWELPLLACRAVGGDEVDALAGAAAVACMQLSLMLVDDMLDKDPRGAHVRLGDAAASNLAFAFQAAAFRVIEGVSTEAERHAAVSASLARMALASAFGQNLDAQNLSGEENYWQVVRTKSAPFFGTALYVGALLGQTVPDVAESLRDFGLVVGEIVQVYDDLVDSLQSPAGPDWKQGRSNLAILYALTADHPERAQLEVLRTQVDDPQALEAAQHILIHCGAISYCVYHIVKRYQTAQQILDSIPLTNPAPLHRLVSGQMEPLIALLESVGAVIPPELEMG